MSAYRFVVTPVDCGEANVEFLDNARIQGVEVEKHDITVIEAFLRLQNQSTCVLSFLGGAFLVLILVIVCFTLLLRSEYMLVRWNVTRFVESVQEQVLIPLRSAAEKCPRLEVLTK